MKSEHIHLTLLIAFIIATIISFINPSGYIIWFLEATPAIIGILILIFLYNRFRFSTLVYVLVFIHALILIYGAHYTYAEAPLGFWMESLFDWTRNNYDKIGHFAQGFIPAIIIREVLIRKKVISSIGWRNFIIVSICLALSAFYEFIEWWIALFSGTVGDTFLGTQGYVWDTQTDMFLAMLGAILALLLLSKLHDKSMRKVKHA